MVFVIIFLYFSSRRLLKHLTSLNQWFHHVPKWIMRTVLVLVITATTIIMTMRRRRKRMTISLEIHWENCAPYDPQQKEEISRCFEEISVSLYFFLESEEKTMLGANVIIIVTCWGSLIGWSQRGSRVRDHCICAVCFYTFKMLLPPLEMLYMLTSWLGQFIA